MSNMKSDKHVKDWSATKEMLGVPLNELLAGKCTGRKGILKQRLVDKEAGSEQWVSVCLTPNGTPVVLECEHDALNAVREIMTMQFKLLVTGLTSEDAMPRPWDFKYEFVDVEPEDVEVESTADADAILKSFSAGGART